MLKRPVKRAVQQECSLQRARATPRPFKSLNHVQKHALRPPSLGALMPSRPWLPERLPACPRAATAIPRLRSARACGPARPLAGRRGTPLPSQHRLRSTERSSEMLMSTSTAAAPSISNCSSATSAVVVEPSTPMIFSAVRSAAACEAALEEAARARTLSPPHWRRAARSGLSRRGAHIDPCAVHAGDYPSL